MCLKTIFIEFELTACHIRESQVQYPYTFNGRTVTKGNSFVAVFVFNKIKRMYVRKKAWQEGEKRV